MIYWREEGQPIRNGFNFYKLNDEKSIGYCFRLGRFIKQVRYSKHLKKWFISRTTI